MPIYAAKFLTSYTKHNTCVACGCKYSYLMERKVVVKSKVLHYSKVEATDAIRKVDNNNSDLHPCPNCGAIQPDMIADYRKRYYKLALIVGILGQLVPIALLFIQFLRVEFAAKIALLTALAPLFVLVWSMLWNPNRNRKRNRAISRSKVMSGKITIDESTPLSEIKPPNTISRIGTGQWFALVLIAMGAGITQLPFLVVDQCGYMMNSFCDPAVVGPGEYVRVYFKQPFQSVNGYWHGECSVKILNTSELGLHPNTKCHFRTKKDRWGEKKIRGSKKYSQIWADVEIPDWGKLIGKKIDLYIQVLATYPRPVSSHEFDVTENKKFDCSVSIAISEQNSGFIFVTSGYLGMLGAVGLICLALFMMFRSNKQYRKFAIVTTEVTQGNTLVTITTN